MKYALGKNERRTRVVREQTTDGPVSREILKLINNYYVRISYDYSIVFLLMRWYIGMPRL